MFWYPSELWECWNLSHLTVPMIWPTINLLSNPFEKISLMAWTATKTYRFLNLNQRNDDILQLIGIMIEDISLEKHDRLYKSWKTSKGCQLLLLITFKSKSYPERNLPLSPYLSAASWCLSLNVMDMHVAWHRHQPFQCDSKNVYIIWCKRSLSLDYSTHFSRYVCFLMEFLQPGEKR